MRRAITCGPASPAWYGTLPPLPGPLAELSATMTARAFAAYARGDWETCDALLTEAGQAAGAIFTAFAEHLVSPAFPYRADHPAWDAFLARVAAMVLGPGSRAP